jgi:hypothetical protein
MVLGDLEIKADPGQPFLQTAGALRTLPQMWMRRRRAHLEGPKALDPDLTPADKP